MGRGRGKGKKQLLREDLGSGEEEKIPPVRRRGRPMKPVKDDVEEEEDEAEKVVEDEEDDDNTKSSILSKDIKNQASENGKKRKRPSQVKDNGDLAKEENGLGSKTSSNELKRSVGFRQNGSRRKNKPRRAAEVGVECR
nr:histone chaperone ASF1-like [Ipomoea batatas]GMD47920.1 histone chaperone ASF1-like [Ipomoea batatas]